MRKKGYVLILAGVGIILLTFILGDNYWSQGGLIQNMRNMEIVVKRTGPKPWDLFKPHPDKIVIPCSYIFSGSIILILVGIGLVLVNKESNLPLPGKDQP